MTGRILGIGLFGLVGIILPFVAADKILGLYYAPAIIGGAPPMFAEIAAFGSAALMASLVMVTCLRWLRHTPDVSVTEDEGVEEPEELPE